MIGRNNANAKKIEAMNPEVKEAYLCSATRVTIGKVEQVVKNQDGKNVFKTQYVAKIRGVIVGNAGEYLHETREAAMEYGKKILEKWRSDFFAKMSDPAKQDSDVTAIEERKDGKIVRQVIILPPIQF